MLLNINATRAFILCFFTILNQKEFRIATVAMFTCDLYAGVVPQMSPPPHDLERLRTTMVNYRGRLHKVGPAAKVGPCPLAVVNNGTDNLSLLVLSNMPEGTNERYQNTGNAISKT